MDTTEIRQRKIPKDHLLSILGDAEFGARDAYEGDSGFLSPRGDEVTLLYPESPLTRPYLMVVAAAEEREVLARVATFGSEIAPVTQWLRVVTPDWARRLAGRDIIPQIDSVSPAWVGAICGELLTRDATELSDIPLSWTLATASFAVARFRALWHDTRPIEKIVDDVNEARRLLRAEPIVVPKHVINIWVHLCNLQQYGNVHSRGKSHEFEIIENCINDITKSGTVSGQNIEAIINYLPELKGIDLIDSIGPEDRVRFFDHVSGILRDKNAQGDDVSVEIICFIVGYIVGRIGAGEANLELLQSLKMEFPSAVIWGAVLPALFRPFPWGRAFNGLGRLILRELGTPLRVIDLPSTDVGLAELRATMNLDVAYKRLPFRTAQRGFAIVEIAPGVSHAVSLQGTTRSSRQSQSEISSRPIQPSLDLIPGSADIHQSEFMSFLLELRDNIDRRIARKAKPDRPPSNYDKQKIRYKRKT